MPLSLTDFAQSKGLSAPSSCLVCSAPDEVREQVEANEALPLTARVKRKDVVIWAREEYGVTISIDSIYKHMVNHV